MMIMIDWFMIIIDGGFGWQKIGLWLNNDDNW